MRRALLIAVPLLLLATAAGVSAAAGARGPEAAEAPAERVAPPRSALRVAQEAGPLRGVVMGWRDGEPVRLVGAHVGTGERSLLTDEHGRFEIPASQRPDRLSVVMPGYDVVRQRVSGNYVVILLRLLDVRAIYLPLDHLRDQAVLDWALDLARRRVVTSLVVDVKDEAGNMLPIVADEVARQIGAVRQTGTDIEAFLEELDRLGIYRIARVVAFLDSAFARAFPSEAVLGYNREVFRDGIDLSWSNPFSDRARQHNLDVGVNAAGYFEEIQYDYVRLPGDAGVAIRGATTNDQRAAIIAQFAEEASTALHAAGAAISFDTFGQTTVIAHDDGIGQILETLGPFLDYYSPMVYPSTWTPGWFGLEYPPADPYQVVLSSVSASARRLAPWNIVVRPWLQDFHDYQARKLFYGATEVREQIEASKAAGGNGFMLWDPSLGYQVGLLSELSKASDGR